MLSVVTKALALTLCLSSCGGPSSVEATGVEVPAERPPLVRVVAVQLREVQQKIETTGYLEAEHSVVVLPRVGGRVESVAVDEGDEVLKGQPLASLDDREIRASLKQVSVQLAEKKVRHELAKLESEATLHRETQAELELKKAEADLKRLLELDPDLISPRELDDATFARDQAKAALAVAQFNTRKAELDVLSADQSVQETRARESEVELQLAEHTILAPISGVVSRRMIKGGEAIGTSTELFEVVETSNLIAYLDRPQRELAMIERAKLVVFTTDSRPNREFRADVEKILPVVDRNTGSFQLRIRVQSEDAALLRPGLFIRAEILTEENRQAIMVPKTAVLAEGEDSIIFYVREALNSIGKARRLKLEVGIEVDQHIESRNRGAQALKPGDLVIVSGHRDLADQTEVEISKE